MDNKIREGTTEDPLFQEQFYQFAADHTVHTFSARTDLGHHAWDDVDMVLGMLNPPCTLTSKTEIV